MSHIGIGPWVILLGGFILCTCWLPFEVGDWWVRRKRQKVNRRLGNSWYFRGMHDRYYRSRK